MNIEKTALKVACELDNELGLSERTCVNWPVTFTHALLVELGKDEPACFQYQDREGNWKPFIDEHHQRLTIESGAWNIRKLFTRPANTAEIESLTVKVTEIEAACVSGFYHERVPVFSQGYPNHEVLELVTAKEVQAYVYSIDKLQAKVKVLTDWLGSAASYVDILGGDSKDYRQALAAVK